MNNLRLLSIFIIVAVFLQLLPINLNASNTKTITVQFSSTPTSATVSKLPLKYGKTFAYSWVFDDGLVEGYRNAFRYLNGGIVDIESTSSIYPGLYSTDGAGNDIPFRASYAWYDGDLHYDTPSYITYGELRDAYDAGWDVINHDESISDNNDIVKTKLGISKNMSQYALPNGDQSYIDPAFADPNIMSVMSQATSFLVGGNTVNLPNGANPVDVNPIIASPTGLSDYLMYRNLISSPSGPNPDIVPDEDYYADADNTYSLSTTGKNYWRQSFTHRVYNGVGNSNFHWAKFKAFVDHLASSYGKNGNDTVWVAGQQEVYEYLLANQKTVVSSDLVGSTLTITLNTTDVPEALRRKALSLRVTADATISSITYADGEFTHTSHNTTSGLINLDWGEHYAVNLVSQTNDAVTLAEKSLLATDKTKAQKWVDLLSAGSVKSTFQNRLNAIPAAERTFQFALHGWTTTEGVWNKYSKIVTTDPTLTDIQTIDGTTTTLELKTAQNFSSKLDASYYLKGAITNNDTGVFPDDYMKMGFVVASGVTGKLRLSNLNPAKLYAFKLLGSIIGRGDGVSRVDGYDSKSTSNYSISGSNTKSGSLNAFQNFQNTFAANGISPTVGGTIDIIVSPNDVAGIGYLNAFTMTEVSPPPVTSLSASPATINQGDSSTLTWSATNATSCSASWTASTATSGTQSVSPTVTTDYTMTCTGAGGSDDATSTVTVRPLPVTSLSASPATINQGDSSTLTWSATNATSCSASWTASTATSGTQSVSPTVTTDYTMTCTGAGGSDDATLSITVIPVSSSSSGFSSAPPVNPAPSPDNPQGGFKVVANQLLYSGDLPLVNLKFFVGSDVTKIAISNFSDFKDANIQTYQPEITWKLANHDKNQKVYVKFYNQAGQATQVIVSEVTLTSLPVFSDLVEFVPTKDVVALINTEKTLVINQVNPEIYFINNGTETTLKLGSGERAAAVSSFREAYGIAPKSEANWVDVLNIANGRWPLKVVKPVEARAYTNFRLVYRRKADMTNSTDVNALKMMGYGVRSTLKRDLKSEAAAIIRFRNTFGFNPSIPRHWNIVRAITYSGVVE